MSITLYISSDSEVAGLDLNRDRCSLAAVLEDLTALAERAGVKPLEAFQSYAAGDLPEVPEGTEELKPCYFSPSEALATINALRAELPKGTFVQYIRRPRKLEAIEADLQDCRRVLSALAEREIRFRFHLGD